MITLATTHIRGATGVSQVMFRDLLGSLDEILQLKHESYDVALAEARASPAADLRLLLPEHQTRVEIDTPTAIEHAKLQSRLCTRLAKVQHSLVTA